MKQLYHFVKLTRLLAVWCVLLVSIDISGVYYQSKVEYLVAKG